MDYKELQKALAALDQASIALEDTYTENEGEITEETEQMEQEISCLKELLTTEGVDMLGAWLKAKEDKKKSLKAEKDYITRQMAAIDKTIAFIKEQVTKVLAATGQDKVKGERGYSFASFTSTTTEILKDAIDEKFLEIAQVGARMNGLPDWVNIQLKTTTGDIKQAGGDALNFIEETSTPSVRFNKPKANKEV